MSIFYNFLTIKSPRKMDLLIGLSMSSISWNFPVPFLHYLMRIIVWYENAVISSNYKIYKHP